MPLLVFAPELLDVFLCIALLLVAWAILPLLQRPLEGIFRQVPIIGDQLVQAFDRGAAAVQAQAAAWAKSGTDALVQTIYVPLVRLSEFIASTTIALETTATFLGTLPGRLSDIAYQAAYQAVVLAGRILTVSTDLANLVASLPGTITTLASELIARAVAVVNASIHTVETALGAGLAAASAALSGAVSALQAQLAAVELHLSTVIAQESTAIRGVIDTDVRAIQGELGQINAKVDPLVAAGLLTLVPALAQELTTTIEECVTPTCDVINPQLGMLQAFLNIGTIALVGAFVGEAIANPEAAAAEVVSIVQPLASAGESLIGAFVTGTA